MNVWHVLTQVITYPRVGSLKTNCCTFCPTSLIPCVNDSRYLYTLFLAVDANFKLKRKNRGIDNPELAPGWASFVEETRYQVYIKDYVDQPEVWVHLYALLLRLEFNVRSD